MTDNSNSRPLDADSPVSVHPSLRKAAGIFRNRHFRLLWISSAIGFTGMQIQVIARALLAWDLTESFGAVGAVALSFVLPMFFFTLVRGSLADRFTSET